MALPSTTYATATPANPSSDLTDVVEVIDLSLLPADWWNAITDTDTTKARFAESLGTEIPGGIDSHTFTNNMDGTGTGWAHVRRYGTRLASGDQPLRVYPPASVNSAYLASDAYGSDNIEPNCRAKYTFSEPTDGTGGASLEDWSGSGNHASRVGGWTGANRVAGKVGYANRFQFSGSGHNTLSVPLAVVQSADTQTSFKMWVKADSSSGEQRFFAYNNDGVGLWIFRINAGSSDSLQWYVNSGGVGVTKTSAGVTSWNHVVGVSTESGAIALYFNGVLVSTDTISTFVGAGTGSFDQSNIGKSYVDASPLFFTGLISAFRANTVNPSAAAIAHNYDNESDPATFWGTWTAAAEPTSTAYQRRRPGIFRVGSRSIS